MAACPVCGLDESTIALPDAVVALRSFPRRWREAMDRYREHDGDDVLARRPAPDTWSAIEYAAHLRDGLRLFDLGLRETLVRDRPEFPAVDADAAASDRSYASADADTVLAEMSEAATALADRAANVPTSDWGRTFTIAGDGEHTAAWIVQHAAHEGAHHLRDIENGLKTVVGHEHRA